MLYMRKFNEFKKRIICLTMTGIVTITGLSLVSCKRNEEQNVKEESSVFEQQSEIKDFPFLSHKIDILPAKSIDWDIIGKIVANDNPEFKEFVNHEYNGIDYFDFLNFNIGTFKTENQSVNYHIVKKDGGVVKPLAFDSCTTINEYVSLLAIFPVHEIDINTPVEKYRFQNYLFNHISGNLVKLTGEEVIQLGDYIVVENGFWEELLYANGEKATNQPYSNIVYDEVTGFLYLVNLYGTKTDILDPKTGKVKTIDGYVTAAFNNYIIVDIADSTAVEVKYLSNFEDELVTKISRDNNFEQISFAHRNEEKPVRFICTQREYINKDSSYLYDGLYDEYANRLSPFYGSVSEAIDDSDYLETTNYGEDQSVSYTGLINLNGIEMFAPTKSNISIINIVGNKVIYAQKSQEIAGNSKVGIMDIIGEVLVNPMYYSIKATEDGFKATSFDDAGNFYITLFDKNLSIVYDERAKTDFQADLLSLKRQLRN